jgi:hypothetical protein
MSGFAPPPLVFPEPASTGIALARGDRGPQGYEGFQGWQGAQGYQGFQGNQGYQGDTGPTGYQGWQGSQGVQGPQGYQGVQGFSGPQGFQGPQGYQGFQGYGYQGTQGQQGPQGPQGADGSGGVQGPQGYGYQGPQGAQGYQGLPGIKLAATINLTMSNIVSISSGTITCEADYSGVLTVNYSGNVNYIKISSTNIGQPSLITYFIKTASGNPFGASDGTLSIIYPSPASCKGGYNVGDNAIYIGPINSGSVALTPTDTGLSSPHVIIKIYV